MSDIKESDLEILTKSLEKSLEKNAENPPLKVSINDLFTPAFMIRYTQFATFKELLEAGKYNLKSLEDFNAILNKEFDELICETTQFRNWEGMQTSAVAEYTKSKRKI